MESNEIENHQENEVCGSRPSEQPENVEITTTLLKGDFLLPIENINSGNEAERKRRVHNEVEQRRKCKINSGIDKLGHVIPACIQEKKSKTQILELALDYIAELKEKYNGVIIEGADKARVEELENLKKENNHLREENRRMSALINNMKVNSNGIQQINSRSKKSRNNQKQQLFAKTIEPMTDFSADIAKLNLEMEQILLNQEITVEPSNPANQNVTTQNLLDQLTQPAPTQDLGLMTTQNINIKVVQNQQNTANKNATNEILLNSSTNTSNATIMNSNLIIKSEESKVNQGQMLLVNNPKLAATGGNQPMRLQVANVDSQPPGSQSIQLLQQPGNQIQLQSGIQNQGMTVSKPIQQIQLSDSTDIKQTPTTSIQLPGNQNIILSNQITDQSKVKNTIQNPQAVTIPHNINRTVSQPAPGQPAAAGNPVMQPMQPMQPIRLIVPIMTTSTGQASMTQQLTFRLPNGQTQTFPLRIIPASTGASLNTSQTTTTTTTNTSNLMPLAPAQTPVANPSGMIRIQPAPPVASTTFPDIKPNGKKKKSKAKPIADITTPVIQQTSTVTAPGNPRVVRVQAPIQIGQKTQSGSQNLVYLQQSGQLIPIYLPSNATPGQNIQNIITGQSGVIAGGMPQGGTSQSGPIQLTIPHQGIQNTLNTQQLNSGQTTSQPQRLTIVPQGKETILNQGTQSQSQTGSTILQTSDQQDTLASIMASSEISDQDSGIESQDLQKSQKQTTNAPLSPLSVLTAELGINEAESHSTKSNEVDGSSQDILAKAAASIFSPGSLDNGDNEHDGNSLMQLEPDNKNNVPQVNRMSSNSCENQRSVLESQSSWLSEPVQPSKPSEKTNVPSKESNVKTKRKESRKKKRQKSTSKESNPLNMSGAGITQELLQMADIASEMPTKSSELRSEDNFQQPLVTSNSQSVTSRYSAEAIISGMASESTTTTTTQPTDTCSISSTSSTPSNSSFPSYTGSNNYVNDILSNSMSASGLPTYINEDEQNQQNSLFSPYKSSTKPSGDVKTEDVVVPSRSVEEKRKSPTLKNRAFSSPVQGISAELLNLADSVSDTQSQSSLQQGQQENILPEFLSPLNSESSLISDQEPKLTISSTASAAQSRPLSSWISHHSRASELASVTQQARSQSNNQPSITPFSTSTARSQSPTSRPSYFSQPWLTTTSTTSTTSSLAFAQSGFSSPVSSTARSSPNLISTQHQQLNVSSVITHSTKALSSPSKQTKTTESKVSPSPRIFTKETIHRTLTMDIAEEPTEEVVKPKKHHTLPISVPDRPPMSSVPDKPSTPTTVKPKTKSKRKKKSVEKKQIVEPPTANTNESLANVGKRALDKDLVDKFPWLSEAGEGSQEDQMSEGVKPNTKNSTSFSVQTLSQSSKNKGDKTVKQNQSAKKKILTPVEEISKPITTKEKEPEHVTETSKGQFWNPSSSFGMLYPPQEPVPETLQRSNSQKSNEPAYSSTSSVITSNHTTYPRYTSHQRTSSSYTPVEVSRSAFSNTMSTSSPQGINTLQNTDNTTNTPSYDPFSTLPQSFASANTCPTNQDSVDNLPEPDIDFLSAPSEPTPLYQQSSNRRISKQQKEVTSSMQSHTSVVQHVLENSPSKQHTSVSQNSMQQNRDFSCVKSSTQNLQSPGYNEQIPNTVLSYQPSVSKGSDNVTDFSYSQQNKLPTSSKPDYSLQNEDHTDIFDTNALDFPSLHDSPPQENSSRASSSVSSAHMFPSHGDNQQMRMDTPRFDNYQHRSSDNLSTMDREGTMNLSQNYYNRHSNISHQVQQPSLKRSAPEQPSHQMSAKRPSRVETSSVNQDSRMGVPTPDSLPRTPLSVDGHVSQDTGRLPTGTSNTTSTHQRHHSSKRNAPSYNNATDNYSPSNRTNGTAPISSRNHKRNNPAQYYCVPPQPHRSESGISHDHPHDLWSLGSPRNSVPPMSEASPFLANFSTSQPTHTSLLSHSELSNAPSSTSSSISPARRIRHPEHPTYLPAPLTSSLLSNQSAKSSREPDIAHFNPMFATRTPTLSMNALQHNFPIFPDHHAPPSFNVGKGPQIPGNMNLASHPHISPNFNFNSIFGDVGTGSNGHVDPSSLNPGLHVPHLHSNASLPVEEHLSLRGHHIPSRHAQTFGGNPVGLNSLMRPNVPPDVRPPYKVSMAMHGQPHFHGASFSGLPPY
ncbi:uncharacterized protein [Antedon mediterranea]|uniref:uncharacterized protein n=1 Tax=Antedon mediterranea TaxID=105859 RepID=UPI003AF67A7E